MAASKESKPAPSQRLAALKRANEVRQQRAELKRALRSGEASVAELVTSPPEFLLSARLSQVLLAVPGYGQVRVNRLLKRCRVSALKTVGGLTQRQREELARALAEE